MGHKFAEIVFTPAVQALQSAAGSRDAYAAMEAAEDYNNKLGYRETSFIAARDSMYMASVGETGWPYVQHRGGPAGFIKLLNERRIGFADYAGNRQYVSTGNFRSENRVSLFLMDYPNRRRLKLLGRVRIVGPDEPQLLAQLEDRGHPARVERGVVIDIEGFDWNCPQHITPRFTETEIDDRLTALREENTRLKTRLRNDGEKPLGSDQATQHSAADILGEGPLELVVSGVRQLAPQVRAFEFRDPAGRELPAVAPGSHLRVPVRLPSGEMTERHYSIASNPGRRDVYEIAVLLEEQGSGGSAAIHASYQIGTRLRIDPPANHFDQHRDERPALLIAGGIGITPIKSIAQDLDNRGIDFTLHYAGRSRDEMAYRDRLERQFGEQLHVHASSEERLDVAAVLGAAGKDTRIYVCGPARLTSAVMAAAAQLGIARERLGLELFA